MRRPQSLRQRSRQRRSSPRPKSRHPALRRWQRQRRRIRRWTPSHGEPPESHVCRSGTPRTSRGERRWDAEQSRCWIDSAASCRRAGLVCGAWRRSSIRKAMQLRRSTVVRCLLAHDETELMDRVPSVTDEELSRIGDRANFYAFSSREGTSRGVPLAVVDVLEGASREPKRQQGERDPGTEEPGASSAKSPVRSDGTGTSSTKWPPLSGSDIPPPTRSSA